MSVSSRRNQSLPLSQVIDELIKENNWTKKLREVDIKDIWLEQMGQGIMRYTHKITLKGNTLIVELTSSVLREELSYGKDKIIKNLNEVLGAEVIEKIKLL